MCHYCLLNNTPTINILALNSKIVYIAECFKYVQRDWIGGKQSQVYCSLTFFAVKRNRINARGVCGYWTYWMEIEMQTQMIFFAHTYSPLYFKKWPDNRTVIYCWNIRTSMVVRAEHNLQLNFYNLHNA